MPTADTDAKDKDDHANQADAARQPRPTVPCCEGNATAHAKKIHEQGKAQGAKHGA